MSNVILDQDVLSGMDGGAVNLPANNYNPRLANNLVVKTGTCILFGFTVTNTNAAAQFVQVFDAATLPADGAVPILAISVPASNGTGFNWIPGRTFRQGVVLCNSSTQATKTIGAADCLFDAQYL